MYIRSILVIFMSLVLLSPLYSNPFARFQRFIVNPNNRALFVIGTSYFVGVTGFCTILYKINAKRGQKHIVSQKQLKGKVDNADSLWKQRGYGGSH